MAEGNMEAQDTQLSASCLCGACHYAFTINQSELPYQPYLCSCDISRRISGVLLTAYVPVPSGNAAPDLRHLRAYRSSSILKRHFCATCGTHMYLEYDEDGHFEVSVGSLLSDGQSDEAVRYKGHMWIEDTKDGGASVWLPKFEDTCDRFARHANQSEQLPLDWNSSVSAQSEQDLLHAYCHCKGVEFFISRPDELSYRATSPLPDVLVPYHSGLSTDNTQGTAWWISKDGKRFVTGHCACTSCRKSSGFDLQQWTFVPLTNLKTVDGAVIDPASLDGAVTVYKSSPDVKRTFCKVCGATVFWQGDMRPSLLDVAVGLFDAQSGARAEEWLQWALSTVLFSEEAHNQRLVQGLKDGMALGR
jgi:hypothetical protein